VSGDYGGCGSEGGIGTGASYGYGEGDSSGSGYGHGDGDGYGYNYIFGYGAGHGDGAGSGYGHGDGDGSGDGYGYGGDDDGMIVGSVAGHEVMVLITAWGRVVRVGCRVGMLEWWRREWRQVAAEEEAAVSVVAADRLLAACSLPLMVHA